MNKTSLVSAVAGLLVALTIGTRAAAQGPGGSGGRSGRAAPTPEITDANATGDAAEVLELERQIETAVVKGDVAFAEAVLASDFHFRHGDGWTRGEKTGGIEDDRAAFMKRIADKEYLVHDLDHPKIEMHGSVAITWGRYVSLFVPKNRNDAVPPMLSTIWFERVWARRDGRWQWLSHRTVWGPHPSPAGIDPTQIPAETPRITCQGSRWRKPQPPPTNRSRKRRPTFSISRQSLEHVCLGAIKRPSTGIRPPTS